MAQPESWEEVCFVSISLQGGSDVEFATLISSIDIDLGAKEITQEDGVGGVCTVLHSPESMSTVTLEAYPVEVSTPSGTTGKGFFDLLNPTTDTTQPISISSNKNRDKIRIAMLWTNDTAATSGAGAVTASSAAYRIVFSDCFVTKVDPKFTDGILSFTITIKVPAYDNSGSSNSLEQSHDGTGAVALAALNSYTSSAKGW